MDLILEQEVEAAWSVEIERRLLEIDAGDVELRQSGMESGTVSLLPGPESIAKLKAEFE